MPYALHDFIENQVVKSKMEQQVRQVPHRSDSVKYAVFISQGKFICYRQQQVEHSGLSLWMFTIVK